MTDRLRLGKKPARNAMRLGFGTYFLADTLPHPPMRFGRVQLIRDWGMFANNRLGTCVWAGSIHETMLWNAETGCSVSFTEQNAISDYSAVTGYNTSNPDSDQGTDMQEAAAYRQKTGILDAAGKRHKIDAYVSLEPGNIDQIALATYLMGAVGLGFKFPDTAMDQFDSAEPWVPLKGSTIEGGHYVPCIGRNSAGNFLIVSWGRLQAVTPAFIEEYMDEGVAYLSFERLKNSVSPLGFDQATLTKDLAAIAAQNAKDITMPQVAGQNIVGASLDQGELAAVNAALTNLVNELPFYERSMISADEINKVSATAIFALDSYRSGKSI